MSSDYIQAVKQKIMGKELVNGKLDPEALSMIHMPNLDNIEVLVKYIKEKNIPGEFVETGVWRGGAVILMAALNKELVLNKKIYAFDSFEGLPKESKYQEDKIVNGSDPRFDYAVSLEEVKANFSKYDLLDDNVIFVKGFFEETIPKVTIDQVSLLRLDGDMYTSTICVLEHLYDKVPVGGVIIIDDYGWELAGCRAAVDTFRQARNIVSKMQQSYEGCVWWIKE